MADFAPASRCHVPWCRSWHWSSDEPAHAAQLAVWRLGTAEVEVFVGQLDPYPPIVRLTRIDDGRQHIRDIDAEFAAHLADVLDALPAGPASWWPRCGPPPRRPESEPGSR